MDDIIKKEYECKCLAEKVSSEIITSYRDDFFNNNLKSVLKKILFERFMNCQESLILSIPGILYSIYELTQNPIFNIYIQEELKVTEEMAKTIVADLVLNLKLALKI